MPILHCKECHHEWEGSADSKCDWCGAGSTILRDRSELEQMLSGREYRKWIKDRT
jgi:hypothetical protein